MKKGLLAKIIFIFSGLVSLLWVIIRVLPKPSRATYPCMKVTMPVAGAFITYLVSLAGTFYFLRKTLVGLKKLNARIVLFSAIICLMMAAAGLYTNQSQASASPGSAVLFTDPLGPNQPIGEAKGLFPGRVVWIHDPNATRADCIPHNFGDGYFLDKNCDQNTVNAMVDEAVLQLTGKADLSVAWDNIFRHFNRMHQKGDTGYVEGEKVFIKINSVHAWNTNGSIPNNSSYGNVDASPQVVYAALDHLVNRAGVPQNMIYVGDTYTQMFDHCYNKWHADFPDVHYIVRSPMAGREAVSRNNMDTIHYSDRGSVLGYNYDEIVDQVSEADYLLNIPAMKGHRWAGVTFFAKNFFGVNNRSGAPHLHPGLHRETEVDPPPRDDYGMYRVFVDLMGSSELGGKVLLYLMDGLWATSEEHRPPVKFKTTPFNNHWSSSILASLDPVAIESVCLDILQKEFQESNTVVFPERFTFVQWNAVDDYLHQAASKDWWPGDITYDPDNTGLPLESLGVHEHWNDTSSMEYNRNLGEANGIELIKVFHARLPDLASTPLHFGKLDVFPNPSVGNVSLDFPESYKFSGILSVFNLNGQLVYRTELEADEAGRSINLDLTYLPAGEYLLKLDHPQKQTGFVISERIIIL